MAKNTTSVGKLYGKKKLILSLALIFGIISIIIIFVTYYGQNVGSFSIRLDGSTEERKIYASTDPEFTYYNSRLEAEPMPNATRTTYSFVVPERCKATNGNFIGSNRGYVSYTFYLKNMGDDAVDINEIIRISNPTNGIEDVTWLWYFEDDEESGTVYQKEDTYFPDGWNGYPSEYPQTQNFASNSVVFEKTILNLRPNEVKKFTVILWMEGRDPDMSEDMSGGMIQINIAFSIRMDTDEA